MSRLVQTLIGRYSWSLNMLKLLVVYDDLFLSLKACWVMRMEMEVVGGAVLSALLEPLVGKLSSGELMKFARKKDVEEELKKWTSRLFEINGVLRDAEQKQITSLAVKSWLSKLRDLAYDVEDVLDEFQTEALASKFKSESGVNTSTALRLIPTCFAGLKPRVVICDVKKRSKLQKITVKLDEIVKEKNNLCLRINAGGRSAGHRRVTTSLVNESDIFREGK
ncbi:hypothetical protein OIU77_020701 [Salix suchowensis]|uniref:Disease resistance N-terminal domain-containing protein n=1 Tax=Salix suchowensis TaxID=1278906 RepID=A0ABQ9C869_9ROSI|nr:hypothetical protein OIU77_020701 [Salix suchowensis]